MDSIFYCKFDYICIVLEEDVVGKGIFIGFERLMLEYCVFFVVDLDVVDLGLIFWGKFLIYFWLISSMIGGMLEVK